MYAIYASHSRQPLKIYAKSGAQHFKCEHPINRSRTQKLRSDYSFTLSPSRSHPCDP